MLSTFLISSPFLTGSRRIWKRSLVRAGLPGYTSGNSRQTRDSKACQLKRSRAYMVSYVAILVVTDTRFCQRVTKALENMDRQRRRRAERDSAKEKTHEAAATLLHELWRGGKKRETAHFWSRLQRGEPTHSAVFLFLYDPSSSYKRPVRTERPREKG